jgi:hypothetical protein
MTRLILALAIILCVGISTVLAEPQNCEDWTNCNMNSPSFDGVCCRICFIPELDHREWVCNRVSDDIGFPDEVSNSLPSNFDFRLDADIDGLIEDYVKEGEEKK